MTDTNWTEPDPVILDEITQQGCFAADEAILSGGRGATAAGQTRIGVRAALRMLLANGIITVTPRDEWPEWVASGPGPTSAVPKATPDDGDGTRWDGTRGHYYLDDPQQLPPAKLLGPRDAFWDLPDVPERPDE